MKAAWAEGSYTGSGVDATAQINAEAIGRCQAYARVAELDYDTMVGEVEDE